MSDYQERYRVAVECGPCAVRETAARMRGDAHNGFGFDIVEGCETVYATAFADVRDVADAGGEARYFAERLRGILGHRPYVRIQRRGPSA